MYDDWNTDHRRWLKRCLFIRGTTLKNTTKLITTSKFKIHLRAYTCKWLLECYQMVGSMSFGLYCPMPGRYQAQLVKSKKRKKEISFISDCSNNPCLINQSFLYWSIYRQSPVKSPDIKNIIVVTLTFLFEKFPTALKKHNYHAEVI